VTFVVKALRQAIPVVLRGRASTAVDTPLDKRRECPHPIGYRHTEVPLAWYYFASE